MSSRGPGDCKLAVFRDNHQVTLDDDGQTVSRLTGPPGPLPGPGIDARENPAIVSIDITVVVNDVNVGSHDVLRPPDFLDGVGPIRSADAEQQTAVSPVFNEVPTFCHLNGVAACAHGIVLPAVSELP